MDVRNMPESPEIFEQAMQNLPECFSPQLLFLDPDHAPIMVAEQIGAFKAQGLDVRIILNTVRLIEDGGNPTLGVERRTFADRPFT
ncbi:RNase adapter RapZ, partial [Klebsiella pneumoniae]|uniref:RNase adapter RapZ n=1 Tax=Klebsiella pneumoniae TaxID=573 RepID=UPI00359C5807